MGRRVKEVEPGLYEIGEELARYVTIAYLKTNQEKISRLLSADELEFSLEDLIHCIEGDKHDAGA